MWNRIKVHSVLLRRPKLGSERRHFLADRRQPIAASNLVARQRKVVRRVAEELDRSAVAVVQLELGRKVQTAGAEHAQSGTRDGGFQICAGELLDIVIGPRL